MTEIAFVFPLANGLHARPASLMQELCLQFDAVISFHNRRNRHRADAKSVLELVASDTAAGDPCCLEIRGPDEQKADKALRAFLRRDFPRADDGLPQPVEPGGRSAWLPPVFHDGAACILPGLALAPGIGRARAVLLQKTGILPRRCAAGKRDAKKELRLFRDACRDVESDLQKKATALKERNAVGIIKAHLAILADPGFRERIADLIAKRKKPAGQAIGETTAHFAGVLQNSRSAYLQERVSDLEDLASQLGEKLYGRSLMKPRRSPCGPYIAITDGLPPSQLLSLDRRPLRGLVLGEVGSTSHTVILARSLRIPAVSLPAQALAQFRAGEELIVDGRRGLVLKEPGPALKRYYRVEEKDLARKRLLHAGREKRPARTLDHVRVRIAANIGSTAELGPAWKSGAEGIGLFRSEILFLERDAPPGEDEQYAAYREAARTAKGNPVVIRTLDIGGDKHLPYLPLPQEENPFLGYRAVRFYAEQPELIQCQLRAILRAARHGNLKIMVPMVTAVAEVRLVRSLLAAASAQLRRRKVDHARHVEVGIMVETPAAALYLDQLGREADFFSIGSNDLLQYFLAADRGNSRLKDLYDPLHPAFLRLLFQIAEQARQAKRRLSMCGEMAGDPAFLPLLLGLGLDELSMACGRIPAVKTRLRQLQSAECRRLLQNAMSCASSREVGEMIRDFNNRSLDLEVIAPELIRLGSASRSADEAIKELCDLLELGGRVENASALEEAVWKREETYATDLGFGFAIPHGKAAAVKTSSIAFLRPARPIRWSGKGTAPVRAVLLIAIPENLKGEDHLRLIARLSRRLMHEDFREMLLSAKNTGTILAAVRGCLTAT